MILQARANAAAAAARAAQALKEQADAEVRLAEARAKSGKSSRASRRSRESQQDAGGTTPQLTDGVTDDVKTGDSGEPDAINDGPAPSRAQEPRAHEDRHHVQLPHRDMQNYSADGWWKAWLPGNHRRDSGQGVTQQAEENLIAEARNIDADASLDPRAEYLAELKSKDLQLHRLRMQIADIEKNENLQTHSAQLNKVPSH